MLRALSRLCVLTFALAGVFGCAGNGGSGSAGGSSTAYSAPSSGAKDVYVRGYTRKDGTYVKPHYRSRPSR